MSESPTVIKSALKRIVFLRSGRRAMEEPIAFCKESEDSVRRSKISGLTSEKSDIASNPSSRVMMILVTNDMHLANRPISRTSLNRMNWTFLLIFLLVIENVPSK